MSKNGTMKIANCEYAPGIATYGIDGRDGVDGVYGTTMFVSVYNINDNDDAIKFGTAILRSHIMTDRSEKKILRDYINGDSFLFQDGSIWMLDDVDGLKNAVATGQITKSEAIKEYMSHVGNIQSSSDSGFTNAGKFLILDSANYKGFVIDSTGNSAASLNEEIHTAPFTIISNEQDNDNVVRFVSLKSMFAGKSDTSFDIYYDSNNDAWVFDSDKPVVFDCDVKFNGTGDSGDFDEYSTPLLSDTPMTRFYALCKKIKYSVGSIEKKQTVLSTEIQRRNMSSYSIVAPKIMEYDIDGNLMKASNNDSKIISLVFRKSTVDISNDSVFSLTDFSKHSLKITVLYDGIPMKSAIEMNNWVNVPRDDQENIDRQTVVYMNKVGGVGTDSRYTVAVNADRLLNGITKDEHITVLCEWAMTVFHKQIVIPIEIPLIQNIDSGSKVPFMFDIDESIEFDDIKNMTIHIVNYDSAGMLVAEYYTIITDVMKNDFMEEHMLKFVLDVNQTFDKNSVWSVSLMDAIEIKLQEIS